MGRCGSGVEEETEGGGVAVVPGTISFSICIKAWAHSDEHNSPTRPPP